jgi:hypothetical protein
MKVMKGSVQFLKDNGFGYIKVDSGSCYNDMELWHDLIESSGQCQHPRSGRSRGVREEGRVG